MDKFKLTPAVADHQKLLLDLSEKHGFGEMKQKVEDIQPNLLVKIGVLGEFDSGKSTLINAMLGKKVLPANPVPTTAAIVGVEPIEGLEKILHFEIVEDELCAISASDFDDKATGHVKGAGETHPLLRLQVPPGGILEQGFLIIDTPGLQSLSSSHTDITFGYLPYLDGAIICHDIDRGNVPASMMNFLKMPEVKALGKSFMFVITKSDRKTEEVQMKMKEEIISQLFETNNTFTAQNVILASPGKVLENVPGHSLEDFANSFRQTFILPKTELLRGRHKKELDELTQETVKYFEAMLEDLAFDDKNIREHEAELEEKLEETHKKQEHEKKRLQTAHEKLEKMLLMECDPFISRIQEAEKENVGKVTEDFSRALANRANIFLTQLLKDMNKDDLSMPGPNLAEINNKIRNIINGVDLGAMVGLAIVAALIGPAAGAGNAAEAGGGAAAGKLAKVLSKLKLKPETMKAMGKVILVGTKALEVVGKVANAVNPFEYFGGMLKDHLQKNAANKVLPQIAMSFADNIFFYLDDSFEKNIFEPINHEIYNLKKAMREADKVREKGTNEVNVKRDELVDGMRKLREFL